MDYHDNSICNYVEGKIPLGSYFYLLLSDVPSIRKLRYALYYNFRELPSQKMYVHTLSDRNSKFVHLEVTKKWRHSNAVPRLKSYQYFDQ